MTDATEYEDSAAEAPTGEIADSAAEDLVAETAGERPIRLQRRSPTRNDGAESADA